MMDDRTTEIDKALKDAGFGPVICRQDVARIMDWSVATVDRKREELPDSIGRSGHPRFLRRDMAKFLAGQG